MNFSITSALDFQAVCLREWKMSDFATKCVAFEDDIERGIL